MVDFYKILKDEEGRAGEFRDEVNDFIRGDDRVPDAVLNKPTITAPSVALSAQQSAAVDAVGQWHQRAIGCRTFRDEREQVYRCYGFAGTGKTTIALEFARQCPGTVLFAAFTGKAAHVMQTKGCVGASTIHSLIYLSRGKSEQRLEALRKQLAKLIEEGGFEADEVARVKTDIIAEERAVGRPSFTLNPDSPLAEASLLIVDECSMVGEQIAKDLLSFRRPILVLGDPAQLPPVRDCGYFTNQPPDTMLTEVHRHALESPIYRMATIVREGRPLMYERWSDGSGVFDKRELTLDRLVAADQVLVGKNETRHNQNRKMRAHLGRIGVNGVYPVVGDKLVALRNEREEGFLNGQTWTCAGDAELLDAKAGHPDRVRFTVRPAGGECDEEGESNTVTAWAQCFDGSGPRDGDNDGYQAPAGRLRLAASEFGYGYALTVHKAQGSQWPRVVVCDQSHVFRKDGVKWLYTGITRAAEGVEVFR